MVAAVPDRVEILASYPRARGQGPRVVIPDESQAALAAVPEPVTFSKPDIVDADAEAVLQVLRSGWLTSGHECAGLEEELRAYLGIPHVVAMSSCTAAMETTFA